MKKAPSLESCISNMPENMAASIGFGLVNVWIGQRLDGGSEVLAAYIEFYHRRKVPNVIPSHRHTGQFGLVAPFTNISMLLERDERHELE